MSTWFLLLCIINMFASLPSQSLHRQYAPLSRCFPFSTLSLCLRVFPSRFLEHDRSVSPQWPEAWTTEPRTGTGRATEPLGPGHGGIHVDLRLHPGHQETPASIIRIQFVFHFNSSSCEPLSWWLSHAYPLPSNLGSHCARLPHLTPMVCSPNTLIFI